MRYNFQDDISKIKEATDDEVMLTWYITLRSMEDVCEIMFAYGGVGNFLINSEDLKNCDFSMLCMTGAAAKDIGY